MNPILEPGEVEQRIAALAHDIREGIPPVPMIREAIVAEIIAALKAVPVGLPPGERDTAWTRAVKAAVGDLGHHLGFGVCGFKEDYGEEWLFDLCWHRSITVGDPPMLRLLDVPLVMESEWNVAPSEINYDFEKLLIAKATFKVMVFQSAGAQKDRIFSNLENGVSLYERTSPGEHYIFACYDDEVGAFDIKHVTTHSCLAPLTDNNQAPPFS